MQNTNTPSNSDLPSKGKLIKSTLLAIGIAAIILVTAVLPAEYGIDPTGVGEMIGLKRMGEIKASLAQEATIAENSKAAEDTSHQAQQEPDVDPIEKVSETGPDSRTDTFTVTLKPNQGKEIKLLMAKGSTVNFTWYTDGGIANFDAHADSKELQIKYHNYEKGKLEKSEGILEAAFDGNHGWFWRNRTSETMNVTLEVKGSYSEVFRYE